MFNFHYISTIIFRAFINSNDANLKTIRPQAEGWIAIIECKRTGNIYKMEISEVKSTIEAKQSDLDFMNIVKSIHL